MKTADFLLLYFLAVNIFAAAAACTDKYCARHGKRRISENFLLTIGFIGGALFEYTAMKIIRHKTRHKKFMIGLPLEIVFHAAVIILVLFFM